MAVIGLRTAILWLAAFASLASAEDEVREWQREIERQKISAMGNAAGGGGETGHGGHPALPSEHAVFEKNVCAICEAVAFQAGAVATAHVNEKRRRSKGRTSDLDFVAELEAKCADGGMWRGQYTHAQVRAGRAQGILSGPGVTRLDDAYDFEAAASARKAFGLSEEYSEFAAMVGGEQPAGPRRPSANITDAMVNTLSGDCQRLLLSGEPDEEELLAAVAKVLGAGEGAAARDDGKAGSREADTPAAAALRPLLCEEACGKRRRKKRKAR